MWQVALFIAGSLLLVAVSRQSLLRVYSHGFYRFFAWESLLLLFALNVQDWFRDPLAWHQLISWALLIGSIPLALAAVRALRSVNRDAYRQDAALLDMEKTARLVTNGIYRYIRHPMYSSLLCLGWGLFFKSPSWLDAGLALLCAFLLFATARAEERENLNYFGAEYADYMRRSTMFIPFVL